MEQVYGGHPKMPLIPSHRAHIFKTVTDAELCGTDSYNLPMTCKVETAVVDAHWEPVDSSMTSTWFEFGRIPKGTSRLFLDEGVDIDQNSQVEIEGINSVFYVYGDPMIYTALYPHIEVTLTREYLNK